MALEYRNELKYVVSSRQIAILRNRIRPLMALDAHTGTKGKYTIRSVYFDDLLFGKCGWDKSEGEVQNTHL